LAAPTQLSAGLLFLLSFAHTLPTNLVIAGEAGAGAPVREAPAPPLRSPRLVASSSSAASFCHAKEMELQRARRRRDELGHQPLCDRIRRRVLRKTHADARGREVTAHRARVNPERRRRFYERSLQHVAQDEGPEVRPAQRVPADELAEARTEEPSSLDGVPDGAGRLAVDLADPQKSRDLRDREPSRLFEAR